MSRKIIKIRLGELRQIIKKELSEGPAGPGVTADPKDVKGFYPYDLTRGTDIHSYWYKSPARGMGSEGDPSRPADAAEYIGFKTKGATPEEAAQEAAPKEAVTTESEEISS